MTTSRRLDPLARVAALRLCLATLDRAPNTADRALADVDAAEVARVLAHIAGELGAKAFDSKAAFRAELHRSIRVLQSAHAAGNGANPVVPE